MNIKKFVKGTAILLLPFLIFVCSGCTEKKETTEKSKYEVQLTAQVKDLSAPVIECKDEISIEPGEKIQWDKQIHVTDNVDESPTYTIKGNVSENKAGTYSVTITAKDKTGNVSNKKIIVQIKEKQKEAPKTESNGSNGSNPDQLTEIPQKNDTAIPPIPSFPALSKFFAFQEGVSRETTYQECMNYVFGQLSGRTGTGSCMVVDDQNGTHIGYQATFN